MFFNKFIIEALDNKPGDPGDMLSRIYTSIADKLNQEGYLTEIKSIEKKNKKYTQIYIFLEDNSNFDEQQYFYLKGFSASIAAFIGGHIEIK